MNKRQITLIAAGTAIAGSFLWLNACPAIPDGAIAVTPFDADRYLGKWYEIARLENWFEKNLNNTTAEYSKNPDGSIRVVNSGYHPIKGEWKRAIGKAKFVESPETAKLKVSFFGPFYAGYNVIALDENYTHALVIGGSTKYMWILSRETSIPESIRKEYLKKAAGLGVKTDELIWVEHTSNR